MGVLSIGKLAAGQEAYYLGKVANGIEDYYVGGGEAEGRWTGSGAATLGLHGTVESDQLQAMLAAKNPASGQPLQDREQTLSGPGFDLTFSAPKSVSLLWAFGDDRVRSQVVAAHEAAVDQALGHLERHAILARRGAGGGTFLPAPNLIGAAYRHRTSRAGDPQIHTHVLVSKLVQATDGRWTCLHSPSLYANAKTAGFLYQAELRDQLTRTLGIRWGEVQEARPRSRGSRSQPKPSSPDDGQRLNQPRPPPAQALVPPGNRRPWRPVRRRTPISNRANSRATGSNAARRSDSPPRPSGNSSAPPAKHRPSRPTPPFSPGRSPSMLRTSSAVT